MISQMRAQDFLTRKLREKTSTTLNNKPNSSRVSMIHLGTIKLQKVKILKLKEYTRTKLMPDRSRTINMEL